MPHLHIQYTANLDAACDIGKLCDTLRETLLGLQKDDGTTLYPLTGTRVLAFAAQHASVADGHPGRGYIYLNLRIMRGRTEALKKMTGEALLASASAFLDPVFGRQGVGLTVHVDEAIDAYEGKRNNLAAHLQG
ncbi:MAG: 5-carboxymethyl-2-hydroxymuconate Delta-isomerase [Comamonadaceae bacterium]|nr:MAG: 5-carboxymethyl-2-hydroxymuconate Delta-isomerase [Comamonadaceae bacterium]